MWLIGIIATALAIEPSPISADVFKNSLMASRSKEPSIPQAEDPSSFASSPAAVIASLVAFLIDVDEIVAPDTPSTSYV